MPVADLPAPRRAFFGRSSELAALTATLRRGGVTTVAGIGGMGKTRLVVELASRWRREGAFVDLTETRTRAALVDALARVVSAGAARAEDLVASIGEALARRGPFLLVLDNFEPLVREADLVAELSRRAPEARIVVTSREILRLSEEAVFVLAPLDASEELLLDRIRLRRGGYAPTRDERDTIAEIARALDGIPLALELAADRVDLLGLDATALGVQRGGHLSAPGPRDAPARHQTLERAFEGSWRSLDAAERALLAACAAFRRGFTAPDVTAIVGSEVPALDALQRLRAKALVVGDAEVRLGLLTVIRDFVLLRIGRDARAAIAARHAAHFAARVGAARPEWIAAEWDNLGAALEQLLSSPAPDPRAADLLLGIGETALRSGRLAMLRDHCDAVLARAAPNDRARAELLVLRSRVARRRGELVVADADLEDALVLAESSGDAELHARILRQKSLRLARAARLEEALATFERARAVHDPARGGHGSAYDVLGLSSALRQGGDAERARVVVETYLRTAVVATDRGLALFELTLADLESGRWESAVASAEEALAIFRRAGWRAEEARALLFVGLAHGMRGDTAEAERRLAETIACSEDAGGASAAEYARGYLGVFLFERGCLEEADTLLERASPPDGGHVALFASYRAAVHAQRGALAKAKAIARGAVRADVPPSLRAAVAVNGVHLALAEARAAGAHPAEAYGRATTAVAAAAGRDEGDTLLALRIARRALSAHRPTELAAAETLFVDERGRWFSFGDAPRVDCSRQTNATKALAALAKARVASPGVALGWRALVDRIWSGEAMLESAAKNRVRVTIAILRKRGLRDVIVSDDAGYRLSEWTVVRIVPDAPAARESAPAL